MQLNCERSEHQPSARQFQCTLGGAARRTVPDGPLEGAESIRDVAEGSGHCRERPNEPNKESQRERPNHEHKHGLEGPDIAEIHGSPVEYGAST